MIKLIKRTIYAYVDDEDEFDRLQTNFLTKYNTQLSNKILWQIPIWKK